MLTEKPWRFEAIVRLLAGITACVFLGSLTLTFLRFNPETAKSAPLVFYSLAGIAFAAFTATLWLVVRPWAPNRIPQRAGLTLICAYAAFALTGTTQYHAGPAPSQNTVWGMLISSLAFQGSSIVLIWVFVKQHGMTLVNGFGIGQDKRRSLLLGATIGLAFIPLVMGLHAGLAMAADAFDIKLPAQNSVLILRLADSWLDLIALGFVTVILAPVAEEALFRGIFYPAIKNLGHPQAAMWITSVVFGLIHWNALSFLPLVVLAVILVKLYEKTGNLLSCIACHAAFNLFNFVMLFLNSQFIKSAAGQ